MRITPHQRTVGNWNAGDGQRAVCRGAMGVEHKDELNGTR